MGGPKGVGAHLWRSPYCRLASLDWVTSGALRNPPNVVAASTLLALACLPLCGSVTKVQGDPTSRLFEVNQMTASRHT